MKDLRQRIEAILATHAREDCDCLLCLSDFEAVDKLEALIAEEKKALAKEISRQLLVWAGYYRGRNINEVAMPSLHEIIDQLKEIEKEQ